MDIKVEDLENILWSNGVEYEIFAQKDEEAAMHILGLRETFELRPIWSDDEGENIFDSGDLYVYAGDTFFGQINADTAESVYEELEKILENYR